VKGPSMTVRPAPSNATRSLVKRNAAHPA
jgi:hypothetical protein